MNIVTYARVSTISQESEGQSLPNQERAFQDWLKRERATRIQSYAESKSAKSIEGRTEFLRMVADLPVLCPDLVIVDTIDRFSRNLKDGLDLLERFKGQGVKLLPLDWDEPVDLDLDRDWKNVVQELTAADYERRRIRSRINKSYAGRRARGATLHSLAPFGLIKQGDVLVADPAITPILRRADRLFLRGDTQRSILHYIQQRCEGAWSTPHGYVHSLTNPEYVKAGVRSRATAERIAARLAVNGKRKARPGYVHSMVGVFACGICVALGSQPDKRLMCGNCPATPKAASRLLCQRRHPHNVGVQESILQLIIIEIFKAMAESPWNISDRNRESFESCQERVLHKHLERLEISQIHYRELRENALRALDGVRDNSVKEARKFLKLLKDKEELLGYRRQQVVTQLSTALFERTAGNSAELKRGLARAAADWAQLDNARKNDLAKSLCQALASHPLLYRNTGFPYEALVTWQEAIPDVVWRVRYGRGITPKAELLAAPSASTGVLQADSYYN